MLWIAGNTFSISFENASMNKGDSYVVLVRKNVNATKEYKDLKSAERKDWINMLNNLYNNQF